eukprot:Hpha_TRINITY_DN16229_c2_g9::TRINITY_DN16229_c2_g9_i3::g.14509::m.14509
MLLLLHGLHGQGNTCLSGWGLLCNVTVGVAVLTSSRQFLLVRVVYSSGPRHGLPDDGLPDDGFLHKQVASGRFAPRGFGGSFGGGFSVARVAVAEDYAKESACTADDEAHKH